MICTKAMAQTDSFNLSKLQGLPLNRDFFLTLPFLSLALLPSVPDILSVRTWLFLVAVGLLVIRYSGRSDAIVTRVGSTELAICLFLFLCVLSYFWGDRSLIGISNWFRQIVPYTFLLLYFIFPNKKKEDVYTLITLFHVSAITFVVVNLGVAVAEAGSDLWYMGRITYANFDFVIPFPFISLCMALFERPYKSRLLSYSHIFLCFAIVIGCGYRSQILLVIFSLIVALTLKKNIRLILIAMVLLLSVYIYGEIALEMPIVSETLSRFEDLGSEVGESSRAIERDFAMDVFLSSPLFGAGLGTPVPVSVIFANDPLIFYDLTQDNVRYIHNLWMYLLMNLGALGLSCYVMIFISPLVSALSSYRSFANLDRSERYRFISGWAIAVLLVYATVEAAYRQIHFNMMIAVFLAVINGLRQSTDSRKLADVA